MAIGGGGSDQKVAFDLTNMTLVEAVRNLLDIPEELWIPKPKSWKDSIDLNARTVASAMPSKKAVSAE